MNQQAGGSGFHAGRGRTILGYGVMLGLIVGSFFGVRSLGAGLIAMPIASAARPMAAHSLIPVETLLHVLLALLVVIVAARMFGALFRRLNQPPVIGEVMAGIALGPSLLGRIAPGVSAYVLPSEVAPFLSVLAQVGVIFFMFLVGMELDTSILRKKPHAALAISHASILAPFVLGGVVALWIYPKLSTTDVPFDLFALFMGLAMSITAFPVLARILTDRGIHKTRIGVIALSCAAVDDVTAWCVLAFVVGMAQSRISGALFTMVLTVGYIGFMFVLVRPLVRRWVRVQELRNELSQHAVAVVFVCLLASALATEYIGIHAIFGAFLLGAVIPHQSPLARSLRHKLEDVVLVLLLPAFFAFTGMRTQIGLVSGIESWTMCVAIIAVACLGKIGGSYVAARLSGLDRRDALSLGALMNTRGLMELVVLNIGLDLGIVSPTLFAMLVLMALATTLATAPLLGWLQRDEELEGAGPATATP